MNIWDIFLQSDKYNLHGTKEIGIHLISDPILKLVIAQVLAEKTRGQNMLGQTVFVILTCLPM